MARRDPPGDPAPTDTLGFRWDAFNNLFWSIGSIGSKEWSAVHGELDQENDDVVDAETALRQFYWAVPSEPKRYDTTPLLTRQLTTRQGVLGRLLPADTFTPARVTKGAGASFARDTRRSKKGGALKGMRPCATFAYAGPAHADVATAKRMTGI